VSEMKIFFFGSQGTQVDRGMLTPCQVDLCGLRSFALYFWS
jgi:hypothetical protein